MPTFTRASKTRLLLGLILALISAQANLQYQEKNQQRKRLVARPNNGGTTKSRDFLNSDSVVCLQFKDSKKPIKGTCLVCQKGFILKNGECMSPSSFECALYSRRGKCLEWNKIAIFNERRLNGNENELPQYCKKTVENFPLLCIECEKGIKLNGYNCIKVDIEGCLSFSDDGQDCLKCHCNYSLLNKSCQMIDFPECENCNEEAEVPVCTKCNNNFFVNKQKDCEKISSYDECEFSDGVNNKCINCFEGFNNVNGKCLQNSENPQEFCENVNEEDPESCNKCFNLYGLSDGFCGSINDNNCKFSDGLAFACTECYSLYYIDAFGFCVGVSGETCLESNGKENLCEKCVSGYYVDAGVCKQIPFCLESEGVEENCTKCQIGYKIKNGLCEKVLFCSVIKPSGSECETCFPGYSLDNDAKCQEIPFCKESNGVLATCTRCTSGFWVNNGVCARIQDCDISDGILKVCTTCSNFGFYPFESGCVKIPGCELSDGSLPVCTKCLSNQVVLQSGLCPFGSVENCQEADPLNSSECKTCKAGYYLENPKSCLNQCLNDCVSFTENKKECKECSAGYFLSNNQCQKIPNCLSSAGKTISCTLCSYPYTATNGECLGLVENCQNQSGVNTCILCSFKGYKLNNGACDFIPNCLTSNGTTKCLECQTGTGDNCSVN